MAYMILNNLLKRYNLNQKDLSESTGINKNTISKYCNNTFENINKIHIDLICKYFKCTPNDIFQIDEGVDVKPAQIMYYDNEIDNIIYGEIIVPSSSKHGLGVAVYNATKNKPISNRFSDREALKIMESLEKENSNNIYISEEDYDLEQMQIRFEIENKLSNNLFLITDNIIYNADISNFSNQLTSDIERYKNMTNSIEASKFMLVYRVLYVVIVQQLKNKQLLEFIVKIRKIYSISPFFSIVEDEELQSLLSESNDLINTLDIKQKD